MTTTTTMTTLIKTSRIETMIAALFGPLLPDFELTVFMLLCSTSVTFGAGCEVTGVAPLCSDTNREREESECVRVRKRERERERERQRERERKREREYHLEWLCRPTCWFRSCSKQTFRGISITHSFGIDFCSFFN